MLRLRRRAGEPFRWVASSKKLREGAHAQEYTPLDGFGGINDSSGFGMYVAQHNQPLFSRSGHNSSHPNSGHDSYDRPHT